MHGARNMMEANAFWPTGFAGGSKPRFPVDLSFLERLFESAPMAAAIVAGPDHRVIIANAASQALAGDAGAVAGRSTADVWPGLQGFLVPILDRIRETAEPFRAVDALLVRETSGTLVERYFNVSCSPICAATGDVEAILLLVDETTKRVLEHRSRDGALALFDRLLSAAPVGIAFLDRELRFAHLNEALAAVHGLPVQAHIGKTRTELLSGLANHDEVGRRLQRVVETGEPALGVEVALTPVDDPNRIHYLRENWYPLRLGDEVFGVGAIVEEISTRRQTEAERDDLLKNEQAARAGAEGSNARLRELNQRLVSTTLRTHEMEQQQRLLAEFSHALAASLDYGSTVDQVVRFPTRHFADYCVLHTVDVDGSIHRIAGAHVDPVKDLALRELHRREGDIPVARDGDVARAMATGQTRFVPEVSADWLHSITQSPGHAQILETAAASSIIVTALAARGRTFGVLTFMQTDRARHFRDTAVEMAEALTVRAALALDNARLYEQAQAAERRYHAVFEGVGDALLVSSPEGQYLDANPAAERLLGYSRDEIRAHRVGDFALDAEAIGARARAAILARGEYREEVLLRRKDGSQVPVEAYARPIDLPTGRTHVSALRDISARRDLERLQQEFIALVSHELRSPLTSVRGFAQLMQRQGQLNPAALEAIIGQTIRQERLVNDLLEVSRIQTGRLTLQLETVALVEVVRGVVAEAQALTRSHVISVVAPVQSPVGRWDRGRLEQVFDNLLSNAIKYSPNGGEILVTIADAGERARVTVADAGQGIPADALPRIFERFYRAESHGVVSGLGLGLHIVRTLVEAHGGAISVESVVDRGSRFTVDLPYESTGPAT